MTDTPPETDEAVTSPVATIDLGPRVANTNGDSDRLPFHLVGDQAALPDGSTDDTLLIGTRPKVAVIVQALAAMGQEDLKAAVALNGLLGMLLDKASTEHLRRRFQDPDDHLDLLDIAPIVQHLVGTWYGGPTGKPSGQQNSRGRTGRSSTVRSRSKASTRST